MGKLNSSKPIIMGHEFCGYVVDSKSESFKKGDFVTCNTILENGKMMGVDYNGSFAEYVKAPSSSCYVFNGDNKKLAAYIEPLAAAMAPIEDKEFLKDKEIAIVGKDRIGKLTESVFRHAGIEAHFIKEFKSDVFYDVIVESWADEDILDKCIDSLKTGGTLILKSRNYNKIPLDLYKIVRKNIKLEGMYYYKDYNKVINFANCFPEIKSFLGKSYSIDDWKLAFSDSENSYQKIFFRMF
jgi:threonine dehydrogenase-like Zn-dependent dehydrogenase